MSSYWGPNYELAIKYFNCDDFSYAKECIDDVLSEFPESCNDPEVLINAANIYFNSTEDFINQPLPNYLTIHEVLEGKYKKVIELTDRGLSISNLSEMNKSILYTLKGNAYDAQADEIANIVSDTLSTEEIKYYVQKGFELHKKSEECFSKVSVNIGDGFVVEKE